MTAKAPGDTWPGLARFSSEWPQVERLLRNVLRVRGVSVFDADDIVQEVATRALATRVPFTSAADLSPWAATVARRLHVTLLRREVRLASDDCLIDLPTLTPLPEDTVHWRNALQLALRELATMDEAKRRAVVAPLLGPTGNREPSSVAVVRHRARKQLRAVVQTALGGIAAVAVRMRLRTAPSYAAVGAVGVAVAAFSFIATPPAPTNATEAPPPPVAARLAAHLGTDSSAATSARRTRTITPRPPTRSAPALSSPNRLVADPVPGSGVKVERTPAPKDPHLACLIDFPVVGTVCTPNTQSTFASPVAPRR